MLGSSAHSVLRLFTSAIVAGKQPQAIYQWMGMAPIKLCLQKQTADEDKHSQDAFGAEKKETASAEK